MKDPWPIHLTTDEEFAAQGWAAVARDADGHAASCHAPFESDEDRQEYLASEAARGCAVTMLSPAEHIRELKLEWNRICDAMNRGTWRGTEAEAIAEIERIKAEIAELEHVK